MSETQYTLTLEDTIYTKQQLMASPLMRQPQIALAGRSNVGKSSLINALGGRKQLAKVSATPGKTASINFYMVEPGGFYLVDLPGYGYAQRSKTERQKWAELINDYLLQAPNLAALGILLDCRLEPQNADLDLIGYARKLGLPLLPVLTKADKCNQKERMTSQKRWQALLAGQKPLLTSASGPAATRLGIEDLWSAIAGSVALAAPATQENMDSDVVE